MLVVYSGNRQTSQQILTGSSSPAQNGNAYGYRVCEASILHRASDLPPVD